MKKYFWLLDNNRPGFSFIYLFTLVFLPSVKFSLQSITNPYLGVKWCPFSEEHFIFFMGTK